MSIYRQFIFLKNFEYITRYYNINHPIPTMDSSLQVSSNGSILMTMDGTYADAFVTGTPIEEDGYTTPPRNVRNAKPSQKDLYMEAKKKSMVARLRLRFERQMMHQLDADRQHMMHQQMLERNRMDDRQQMEGRCMDILRRTYE
jgi:hypothetical protein